jgi:hypothetical protein
MSATSKWVMRFNRLVTTPYREPVERAPEPTPKSVLTRLRLPPTLGEHLRPARRFPWLLGAVLAMALPPLLVGACTCVVYALQ